MSSSSHPPVHPHPAFATGCARRPHAPSSRPPRRCSRPTGSRRGWSGIAAQAGVAVGTLYNHFEDRRSLVAALVSSRREALLSRLDAALVASRGAPAAEELRAFLGAVEEHARAHGPLLTVLVQAGEGPGAVRPPQTLHDELVRRANAIVARGVASGELRADRSKVFGLALVGMARAVLLRAIERGSEPGEAGDAVVELFLRGASR